MKLDDLVLTSFAQMLEALAGQLEKAKVQVGSTNTSPDLLMSGRLAIDMLPLSSQIRFACMQAEEAKARLFDDAVETVKLPDSLDEAELLVLRTANNLRSVAAKAQPADEARAIELKLPMGMTFDLDLGEYIRSWAIPPFYFHLVTAYAIMRQQGIQIGKADYVPHMQAFRRTS